LAAGLRPDPLGELKRSPGPLRGGEGKRGEWRGGKEEEGKEREKGSPHFFKFTPL